MRKLVYTIIGIFLFIGCNESKTEKPVKYDFEALRDTLGLDTTCIFVEECSPLYTDDNPYGFSNTDIRVKTLFYSTHYNEMTESIDTVVFAVCRDNGILFWGRNEGSYYAKDLIEWTINNRDKI